MRTVASQHAQIDEWKPKGASNTMSDVKTMPVRDVDWLRVTDEPKGFRDVYWCLLLNEPFVIEYDGNKPTCPNCDCGPFDSVEQMAGNDHVFVCHVAKG